ncbi:MAG: iron-containing alcohol dehydrogenase [Spirochaetia bacterium]|nr:iron-containing alcohol dehydrogenase [Spirochaetia bacterium]
MTNNWPQFTLPAKIYFENKSFEKIANIIGGIGGRVLLLAIKKENHIPEKLEEFHGILSNQNEGCILYDELIGDPDTEQIDSATHFAKKAHADVLVAFGGIDTFNTAKAVSLLASNSFFAKDLITKAKTPKVDALPLITVPVEPSMGEEMSPGFCVIDAEESVRKYYYHEMLYPKAVCYDPALSSYVTIDKASRIGGALLAYAIEASISSNANPVTTTLANKVIENLHKNLASYYSDPKNEKISSDMMWASAMIGAAACSAPVGTAWAIAMGLSAEAQMDFHNSIALILPHVMEYFLTSSPGKYVSIARNLGEEVSEISVIEAAIKSVEGVRKLFSSINLPERLSEFDVTKQQIPQIARAALELPHISNSPRRLDQNEIESILLAAF